MNLARGLLVGFLLLSAPACEAPDPETLDGLAARLEERAQAQFASGPKTGMLRALEVSHRAAQVARGVSVAPAPACTMDIAQGGAFHYDFDLLLERRGPGKVGVTARWHETRELRRSAEGWLDLAMAAQFRTPTMLPTDAPGRRAMRWIIANDFSYLSDDLKNEAPEFYQRKANIGEAVALKFAGLSTLQTLLDAVSQGWQRVPGDRSKWKPGGQSLRCMMPVQGLQNAKNMPIQTRQIEANWGRLFGEVSTLVAADFEVLNGQENDPEKPPLSRKLTLEWHLSDGATLRAEFRDSWKETATPIVLPARQNIVEVERDRSLYEARQRLQDWRANAWIKPVADVEKP